MTAGPGSEEPRRRAVMTSALVGAVVWAGTCAVALAWVVLTDGRSAGVGAFVVVSVGYVVHVVER